MINIVVSNKWHNYSMSFNKITYYTNDTRKIS